VNHDISAMYVHILSLLSLDEHITWGVILRIESHDFTLVLTEVSRRYNATPIPT
jgi:hypothetical protein